MAAEEFNLWIDKEYQKWVAQYRRAMGWELQYEDAHDRARTAFIAGYTLAYQLLKQQEEAKALANKNLQLASEILKNL